MRIHLPPFNASQFRSEVREKVSHGGKLLKRQVSKAASTSKKGAQKSSQKIAKEWPRVKELAQALGRLASNKASLLKRKVESHLKDSGLSVSQRTGPQQRLLSSLKVHALMPPHSTEGKQNFNQFQMKMTKLLADINLHTTRDIDHLRKDQEAEILVAGIERVRAFREEVAKITPENYSTELFNFYKGEGQQELLEFFTIFQTEMGALLDQRELQLLKKLSKNESISTAQSVESAPAREARIDSLQEVNSLIVKMLHILEETNSFLSRTPESLGKAMSRVGDLKARVEQMGKKYHKDLLKKLDKEERKKLEERLAGLQKSVLPMLEEAEKLYKKIQKSQSG